MRAVLYSRISADIAKDGHGIAQHMAECDELARKLGWTVVGRFSDNDLTAYKRKQRPGYDEMLEMLRSGQADAVIVVDTDRLYRSLTELEQFLELCHAHSITVQTVRGGSFDLTTAAGRMVASMLAVAARHEVAHMVERQKASHAHRASEGKFRGGRRPFGFEVDGVTLVPEEAVAIKSGTADVLAGRSLRAIVREWNEAGLLTATGKQWHSTTVRRVLQRPRNAGLVEHLGQVVAKAEWPAIVDEEDWRAVSMILSDPSRRGLNHQLKRRWLGSGYFKCGIEGCGATMGVNTTVKGRRQYRCSAKAHLTRSMEPLDEWIEDLVVRRLSKPDAVLAVAALKAPDVDVPTLQRRRDADSGQLAVVMQMFVDEEIDADQLKVGTAQLRARIKEIDAELAAARARSPLLDLVSADDVQAAWDDMPVDVRGAVLNEVMEVTVMPIPLGQRNKPFDPRFIDIEWRV